MRAYADAEYLKTQTVGNIGTIDQARRKKENEYVQSRSLSSSNKNASKTQVIKKGFLWLVSVCKSVFLEFDIREESRNDMVSKLDKSQFIR